MPKDIRSATAYMLMAKAYNHLTGANLTHWDMMELGMKEETVLTLSIKSLMPADKK